MGRASARSPEAHPPGDPRQDGAFVPISPATAPVRSGLMDMRDLWKLDATAQAALVRRARGDGARAGRGRDRAHRAVEPADQRRGHAAVRRGAAPGARWRLRRRAVRRRAAAAEGRIDRGRRHAVLHRHAACCATSAIARSARRSWRSRFQRAGFIFLGKTNVPELSVGHHDGAGGIRRRRAIRGTSRARRADRAADRRRPWRAA